MSREYLSGVVEGFYGREWSWQARRDYAGFLAAHKLNTYLYCPKGDRFLRHEWQEAWPEEIRSELRALAACYRTKALNWGVGLSPYALYLDYGTRQKQALRDKIEQIDALGGNLLAILFDDMPGDCTDLAQRQAEIVADVRQWSAAEHLLCCPTYYSYDPVLERFFGAMPENYWEDLGQLLAPDIALFWTGNEVCSQSIRASDITEIAAKLERAPLLWDNYPVNDGEKASRYLHLDPMPDRDSALANVVAGHLCNPMNQAYLSMYPLAGLAAATPQLDRYFGSALSEQLARDRGLFQERGLDQIEASLRSDLVLCYRSFGEAAADEIADWLEEKYRFDPACLTG